MIRHICMFTMKPENKEANIAEFLRRGNELAKHPTISAAQVLRNAPRTPDNNYDVALIFDFESVEKLDEYRVSPTHVEFGKFVGAIRESRAAFDYEM